MWRRVSWYTGTSRKTPASYKDSSWYSQKSVTRLYPKPLESTLDLHALFLKAVVSYYNVSPN